MARPTGPWSMVVAMKRIVVCLALAVLVGCSDGGASLPRLEFIYDGTDETTARIIRQMYQGCEGTPKRQWAAFQQSDGKMILSGPCDDERFWTPSGEPRAPSLATDGP